MAPKPKSSSPKKSEDGAGVNLSTQIISSATTSEATGQGAGAPRREVSPLRARSVSPQRSPRRRAWNRGGDSESDDDEVFGNEAALRKYYRELTSVEHQSLLQMFEFMVVRIPSMFSQIQIRGNVEIHEIIGLIQSFAKTTKMMRRCHSEHQQIVDVCRALRRFWNETGEVISVHSKLPGLGRQVHALLRTEAAKYLCGKEKIQMASEILAGSNESCKFPFQASGFALATWKSRRADNATGHSRAPKRPFADKSGGPSGGASASKKRAEFKN